MQSRSAVAGVGETAYYARGKCPDSEFQLACAAIRAAVADAGLELAQVDGLVSYLEARNDPMRLSATLGFDELRWSAQPWGGGGNGVAAAVALADAAVTAGYAKHVIVFRALAQGQFGRYGRSRGAPRFRGTSAWTGTYGLLSPAQTCAMQTARFMHDHGVGQEALCDVAMACYANAQRNPRALRCGQPLTREAYHASRWIVEPFHLYDCCPENDGAAALLVTTSERARDLRKGAVPIVAAAQGLGSRDGVGVFNERSFPTAFHREVGRQIWERSGARPEDIDVAQFYENFTGPVLIAISEMGFCEPGEIGAFVGGGRLEGPDAAFPFNTSGGNLGEGYIHGFELLNEAVRQVRGESSCQVPDVKLSLAVAGPGYSPGSAVLFGAA